MPIPHLAIVQINIQKLRFSNFEVWETDLRLIGLRSRGYRERLQKLCSWGNYFSQLD